MKKTLAAAAVIIIFVLCQGIIGNYETHYTREVYVTEVDGDKITTEDNGGNLWEFYSNEEYTIGQKLKLKMFTNYTDNDIYDDEVLDVQI